MHQASFEGRLNTDYSKEDRAVKYEVPNGFKTFADSTSTLPINLNSAKLS